MPASKPVYVLGVGLSHNGSACLLKDGKIAVAIEKERLTRKKNDGGNDTAAIAYCLAAAGIGFDEIDLVVQNANFGGFRYGNGWYRGPRIIPEEMRVVTISHHLAHACSAYYLSPFEEATVLVVDGCGNSFEDCTDLGGAALAERPDGDLASLFFEKDSFYRADTTGLSALYKDFSPWGRVQSEYPMHPPTTRHSIGGLYSAASKYCFFHDVDLGKLMGLAPFGRPGQHDHRIFDIREGRLFLRYDWMENFTQPVLSDADFSQRFQYFADVAWQVQREVERALLELAAARYQMHPGRNLCFAGGVALNAVANERILRQSPFERLFVPPAADDSGLAIGCAYYGWNEVLGRERVFHDGSPFLGRGHDIDDGDIERLFAGTDRDAVTISRPDDLARAMAERLADGKVLAWFRGGVEFGPRALGHRSILGDPRRTELKAFINGRVKFREDFRPFAPAVLAEEAETYFELRGESPYMLRVVPVRPQWQETIAAVVHVDGTARVQTVSAKADPAFHAVLEAFKQKTGIGVLINTSLNRRGEPIVETPSHAVKLFMETALHGLVLGPYLVEKR